jgi:hypothetical protein
MTGLPQKKLSRVDIGLQLCLDKSEYAQFVKRLKITKTVVPVLKKTEVEPCFSWCEQHYETCVFFDSIKVQLVPPPYSAHYY